VHGALPKELRKISSVGLDRFLCPLIWKIEPAAVEEMSLPAADEHEVERRLRGAFLPDVRASHGNCELVQRPDSAGQKASKERLTAADVTRKIPRQF